MLNKSSYGSLTFCKKKKKLHAWEKQDSQFIAKSDSWPMRFQYSLGMQIGMNDRNKVFLKKKFVWTNRPILGPKMAHPYNSGSIVRIF